MLSAVSSEGRLAGSLQSRFLGRLFTRWGGRAGSTPTGQIGSTAGAGEFQTVSFGDGKLFAMDISGQCRINCIAGMIWVTFQDRRCDYVLGAGESLVLSKKGKVIISGGDRRDGVAEVLYE